MNAVNSKVRAAGLAGVLGVGVLAAAGTAGTFASPAAGGNQAVSSNPDLVSAKIVRGYDATASAPVARISACYDKGLNAAATGSFRIEGYDQAASVAATGAAVDSANPSCVLVDFPATTDVADYTILQDTGSGAKTLAGQSSTGGAAALEGSRRVARLGATAGPDLTGTPTISATDKTVTFTFDTILKPGALSAADAAKFETFDASGAALAAPTGVVASGTTAVATYAAVTGAAAPVRFAVLAGAVTSVTAGDKNPLGSAGAGTLKPELTSVTPVGTNQYTLTYDTKVVATKATVAAGIRAYTEDGQTPIAATDVASGSGTTSLLVTFGSVDKFNQKIVGISDDGAATDSANASLASTPSYVGVRTANSVAGFTDGPDLRQVILNPASNSATFTFDENVNDAAAPAAAGFHLLDVNGVSVAGTGAAVSGSTVTVQYTAAQLASAKAAGVAENAVCDAEGNTGNCSPLSTVALGPLPTTTPPPTTTTTPPTTTTTPVTPPTARIKPTKVTASARRSGRRIVVKGTVSLPKSLSAAIRKFACGTKSTVKATGKVGSRTVVTKSATLKSSCTYSATITVPSAAKLKHAKSLRLSVKYNGNKYISARSAKTITVKLR